MRDIEKTYNDAYVEFYGQRSGMGAMPYINVAGWPTEDNAFAASLVNFSGIWWSTANRRRPNRLHTIGIENASTGAMVGCTPWLSDTYTVKGVSYVFVKKIEDAYPSNSLLRRKNIQYCTVHENGHLFSIDASLTYTFHCSNLAWPGTMPCIMQPTFEATSNIAPRLCIPHLFTAGEDNIDVSIRNQEDPLPY
jgi:hypothetical protein